MSILKQLQKLSLVPHIDVRQILFFDIETRSKKKELSDLEPIEQKLWAKKINGKAKFLVEDDPNVETKQQALEILYRDNAPLKATYGQVICLTIGYIVEKGDYIGIRLKTFYNEDEGKMLREFVDFLTPLFIGDNRKFTYLCGHAIKNFDIPFIIKRLISHRIPVPSYLNMTFKKPWNLDHFLDTMEMWKMNSYDGNESLPALCHLFGVPTPKDDIDGSEVRRVFWEEGDVNRILDYCDKDVVATTNVFMRMVGYSIIKNVTNSRLSN